MSVYKNIQLGDYVIVGDTQYRIVGIQPNGTLVGKEALHGDVVRVINPDEITK
ncbi:hypothetical protein IV38_GL001221 [Lactobacillus selangorensis]|uniref:Uncharacterized protein n=1 Tax=Lactobacillus selangorensis TaxID=81857 RepID=A0A0R2G588_9LACO|nr:hypothetical protein [Lactobacillus selangorensis]KRN29007.1 hypothetical protein IV38_GL001221 [Lactobacillus selangorensis]KRN32583.1 hypothetical protein IV40_GL000632 [Lactobacillus selangorensis]